VRIAEAANLTLSSGARGTPRIYTHAPRITE